MAAATEPVTERPGWKALAAHCQQVRRLHLRKLFAEDPERGERLTADAMGIYLDYSAIFEAGACEKCWECWARRPGAGCGVRRC